MRYVAFRHDASMHIRGRIVTDRNKTHGKRIRVGRALAINCKHSKTDQEWKVESRFSARHGDT